ncbi:MAG: hypothetical protein JRK53_00015 [Deltaproteobacteria bacterium]|nr:hypothetical protein [Deltaproteobacteria bacterium]
MTYHGFAGKILYVDLSSGQTKSEPLNSELVNKFVGGRGINHKLAYDMLPVEVDAFSPKNLIILGAGPFSGTLIPGCSELVATTKFPINNAMATASGAGKFSLMLKTSGYDHVVISGRAAGPVYLKIHDDDVVLCNAEDLWGRDSFDTVDELRKRHEPCSVIPIGQAGENLVKISVSQIDKGGTLGSGGLPAVMGSKNLKAIVAVEGTRGIGIADRQGLMKIIKELLARMTKWPGRDVLLNAGFSGEVSASQFATFPYDNWTKIDFNELNQEERNQLLALHAKCTKTLACPGCPMADKERIRICEGKYAGTTSYVSGMLLRRFGAENLEDAYGMSVKYADTLNRYGLCEINFDFLFSLMLHVFNKGIISKEDTGLTDDFDTRLKVAEMTAYRKGFGDVLADGILAAVGKLGRGIENYAVHIKGRSPHVEPRVIGLGTMPLTQLTDPRGAYPAGGGGPGYVPGKEARHGERMGIPKEALDRIVTTDDWNVGRFTRYSQDWYSLWDCLGMCLRAPVSRFYHIKTLAELYTSLTGFDTSPEELMKGAERAWNLHRLYNAKLGFGRKDDKPPGKWFKPLEGTDGKKYPLMDYYRTKVLKEGDLEGPLDDYYDERGWDKKTGLPTSQKLDELGLRDIV